MDRRPCGSGVDARSNGHVATAGARLPTAFDVEQAGDEYPKVKPANSRRLLSGTSRTLPCPRAPTSSQTTFNLFSPINHSAHIYGLIAPANLRQRPPIALELPDPRSFLQLNHGSEAATFVKQQQPWPIINAPVRMVLRMELPVTVVLAAMRSPRGRSRSGNLSPTRHN